MQRSSFVHRGRAGKENKKAEEEEQSTGKPKTIDEQGGVTAGETEAKQEPVETNGNDNNERVKDAELNSAEKEEEAESPNATVTIGGQSIKISVVPAENPDESPVKEKDDSHPQDRMNKFWTNFDPEYLGKVSRILPESLADKGSTQKGPDVQTALNAVRSYEQARDSCIRDVKRIIRECKALNQKYTDIHFDLERDLKVTRARDCLESLSIESEGEAEEEDDDTPSDVKRVTDIFEAPEFYVSGASYNDILQGSVGDCWFLSCLSALSCNQDFIERVCVIQDQEVGVYGFVFHRDGEWNQCIIDDKLYMRAPSFDESGDVVLGSYGISRENQEDKYEELFQRGSKSLYFAQCRDQNETWVSLLEKAYAKAHGDYAAISGGQTGEAIEDLSGGVTTEIYTTNILNKDSFWKNELSRIGEDFVFSCAVAQWREWRSNFNNFFVRESRRYGIVSGHAYAVLDTYEGHGERLVKIRNPWGEREWTGAWSDGSKEWTAEWLKRLDHQFGDDGVFWMSYKDMLNKYRYIDRTRIFGKEWHVAQQWCSLQVPWSTLDYQATKFSINVSADTPAVIVLSQLDDRYFKGLEGKYRFVLQFRIQNDSEDDEEYLARTRLNYELIRSVNCEVELQKGTYTVLVKVEAFQSAQPDVEDVVRKNIDRKEKVTQIGKLYDLAHRKGQIGSSTPSTAAAVVNGETGPPAAAAAAAAAVSSPAPSPNAQDDPDRTPWNAVCIAGLRVYSKLSDLSLKVILPPPPPPPVTTEETSKTDEAQQQPQQQAQLSSATLDRDDVAKSALDNANASANANTTTTATTEPQPAKDITATESTAAQDTVKDEKSQEEVKNGNEEAVGVQNAS